MNHSELIKSIATNTGHTQVAVKEVLDSLVVHIHDGVRANREVVLQGVAKFYRGKREARMGRNPATGAPLQIAAKNVPVVQVLKPLKDAAI